MCAHKHAQIDHGINKHTRCHTYIYMYIYTQLNVRMCEVGKFSVMKLGPSKRLHKQIKQMQDEPPAWKVHIDTNECKHA